jgi:hypothetical protein
VAFPAVGPHVEGWLIAGPLSGFLKLRRYPVAT